jgi:hypothetical protein
VSEKISLKPMPKGAETVLVTKLSAARSQLETAIYLWFHEIDPVSVHTLAVAAHDCFVALVKHAVGKPSDLQQWLAEGSKGRRKRIPIAQNFFKHGANKLKATVPLHSIDSEAFMIDGVMSFEVLAKERSPLMRLYLQRFLYEHPALIVEQMLPEFAKSAEVHQLFDSTRKEFFERLYPTFVQRFGNAE